VNASSGAASPSGGPTPSGGPAASGGPAPSGVPAPPTASSRPGLRRRRQDRVVAGVAGGLADHFGLDVALVRIVLVVLALFNGLGVLLYIVGWIAIPQAEPGAPPPPPARTGGQLAGRDPLFWVGVGLLVLGAISLVAGPLALLPAGSAPQFVIPLVLIGFGLALWRAGEPTTDADPAADLAPANAPEDTMTTRSLAPTAGGHAAVPAPPGAAAGGLSPAGATGPGGGGPAQPGGPGDAAHGAGGGFTPPPAPERRPSWVTRVTLGLTLVTVGVLWLLRLADVVAIGVGTILSIALLVIGLGLLVGSVVGRARWLILAGGALLPVVLAVQLVAPAFGSFPPVWDGAGPGRSAGEIREAPADLDELERIYELGAGSIRLDLTAIDFADETVPLRVQVGAGEIHVTVPDDLEVQATGRSGVGDVRLFDEVRSSGFDSGPISTTVSPPGAEGRLELDLRSGLGEVCVTTDQRAGAC
jgi:phage shock protein PspC (stress-responsive transcriptional regulator)